MKELNSREILYAFVGWLMARDGTIEMGGHKDLSPVIKLLNQFCESQKLQMA